MQAKPRPVSSLLDSTFKRYGVSRKVEQYSIFEYWRQIVGGELSRIAFPEKIARGKILVVRVLDSAWAQELTLRKDQILNEFRRLPSGAVVEDIRFIVSGPTTAEEQELLA